jgi:hypothetical protein
MAVCRHDKPTMRHPLADRYKMAAGFDEIHMSLSRPAESVDRQLIGRKEFLNRLVKRIQWFCPAVDSPLDSTLYGVAG